MDFSGLSDDGLLEMYYKIREKQADEELTAEILKIFLNSFYGAGALDSNPFSSGRLTNASVTISGRCMNKMVGLKIDNYISLKTGEEPNFRLDHVVQADTDSNYIVIGDLLDPGTDEEKLQQSLDTVENEIEPLIKQRVEELCDLFNVRDPKVMNAENEIISKGFVSVASKRYYTKLLVKDKTILGKPKMKIVGLSLKGKSTPELSKEKLEPVLDIILDGGQEGLKQYINKTSEDFCNADIDDISRKVKVNNLEYLKEGSKYIRYNNGKKLTAPINSHAALVYNDYIIKNQLDGQFRKIEEASAIRYLYLHEPNIFNSKVIAFQDYKFLENCVSNDIVDLGTHFEKDFKDKIRIITKAIGWNIDSCEVLDEW